MKNLLKRFFFVLKTINAESLLLTKDFNVLGDYLRKVHSAFLSSACRPLRPIEISALRGKKDCAEVFLPFGHIKPGSSPFGDLATLAALSKMKSPKRIFEIGTYEGLSAVVLAKNADSDVRLFTLDLPSEGSTNSRTRRSYRTQSVRGPYERGRLIDRMDCRRNVTELLGDSALFDFSPYAGSIDLFFIDGAHTRDYVARDSLSAFKSINAEGWVIWHDCFVPQVNRVIRKIAKYHPVFHIKDTHLAVILEKPGDAFPWEILQSDIR